MFNELILSSYTYDVGRIAINNAFSGQASFNILSAVTIYSGTTELSTLFNNLIIDYWTSGSSGNYSIKANNPSSTDATGDYAVAFGQNVIASGEGSVVIGGKDNIASGEGSVIVGASGITATQPYTTYVGSLNISNVGTNTAAYNLALDSSGMVVTGSVASSNSFQTLIDTATIVWGVDISLNAIVTLNNNRTLSITGLTDGDSGTLIVKQDGIGGRTLSLTSTPGTHKIVNSGGGTIILSENANSEDIISFLYHADTTTFYWNIGYNYS